MGQARQGLATALAEVEILPPSGKFINNAGARQLTDPEQIRDSLARQVVNPVRWSQSCRLLLDEGEDKFFEIGPGRVCQGLMKRIERSATVRCIGSMADIESLAKED